MKRVCAWCNGPMDDSEAEAAEGVDLITHGLCERCEAFIASNEPKSLRQFVNLFSEPVVCVDDGLHCAGGRMPVALVPVPVTINVAPPPAATRDR